MRLKSIEVLRGYAMGKTQLSEIADNIEHEVDEALEFSRSENAKLRELIANVHEALCSDKAGMFHKLILASMEYDMRELGVEVDG